MKKFYITIWNGKIQFLDNKFRHCYNSKIQYMSMK